MQKKLTDQQKRMILQQGVTQERIADGVYSAVNHAFLYWPLEITNIGNGPAIDFRFGFNNHNGYNKDTARFVPPMPLKLEDSLYVAIFAEDIKEKHCGTYLIEFYYKDVFGNNYRQEHQLTIKKNDKGNIQAQLDCGLQQKKLLPDDLPKQFL